MQQRAEDIFREHGGLLRMSEAINLGITRYMLYAMRDRGVIETVSRGIYRLTELPPIYYLDLVTVSLRFPNAVICLISALDYHNITTEIPHMVYMAVPRGSRIPKLDWPPIRVFQFSRATYECGIKTHLIDQVPVRIYSREKTLVDCFKFRNKVGLDVALEALKYYRERHRMDLIALQDYARVCRVEQVMRPYLEASL